MILADIDLNTWVPEVVSVSVNVLMDLQHPVRGVLVLERTGRRSGTQTDV